MAKLKDWVRGKLDGWTKRNSATLALTAPVDALAPKGYRALSTCPEIQTAIDQIADIIGTMTVHLMANTKEGDVRIVNNLSRKIDIEPCRYMTRQAFMAKIARDLVLYGNSWILPEISGGRIEDLRPIDQSRVSVVDNADGYGYTVRIGGKVFAHDEIVHPILHPDDRRPWIGRGMTVLLKDIAERIGQARHTSKVLMESPAPSLIVKVDGLTEEFASSIGRKKLREQYIDSSDAGQPWFIPCEAFEVEKVPPLNLEDLAIIDSISLDKRTVAALVGVPSFMLGEGKFNKEEYNAFIKSRVLPIATAIVQEFTLKLLIKEEWYFKFNPRSLYAYSLKDIADIGGPMVDRMVIDRNEVRDWMGFQPREGLSELVILENYIPLSKIGDQKKLKEQSDGK
ncbi:MAG: phage portal protein [Clostridia bacterium]|nr:phage portal protein [Clostridia bacterium]